MENAACNCFVSRAVLNESERIVRGVRKEVLYNGVSNAFIKFSEQQRESLRKGYGVLPGDKIVAFVGSIVEVKNVRVLPAIFHEIRSRYDGNVKFWMVGDGKLRSAVEPAMLSDETIDVRFWGNVPADEMPSVMNCIDVMLLPSFNEGLPLVCAEAVRCGAKVVGSDVGGIPEIIGRESVISHGKGFVESMAVKAVDMLESDNMQTIPDSMDWTVTAIRELSMIRSVLS
jgi:glycosyltransferase involved in cell wall biosynthesis